MEPRVYTPSVTRVGERLAVPADEAGHLVRVLRVRVGDMVRVFNGHGLEFAARVEQAARGHVEVCTLEALPVVAEPSTALTLAVAMLKGDKMDDVVRDAVMLGVTCIQPLVTAHTEVRAAAIERSGRVERWVRVAVASAKQCGRATVPTVAAPVTFEAALDATQRDAPGHQALMFVEPACRVETVAVADLDRTPPARATVLVGPEGGWSADELARAGRGCYVTLGARTLRADAVPLVAVSSLWTVWRSW